MDKTYKLLLAIIGIGLWALVAVLVVRSFIASPAEAQSGRTAIENIIEDCRVTGSVHVDIESGDGEIQSGRIRC